MKVYSGVYLYNGLINQVVAFTSYEKAKEWFMSFTECQGGKDACEEGDYEVSEKVMRFFDSLGRGNTEVYIELIEMDKG